MHKLRNLPKIDKITTCEEFENLNKSRITQIAREVIEKKRKQILSGKQIKIDFNEIKNDILAIYNLSLEKSLIPLINATGIIIHTNLGRSPIHEEIYENAKNVACGYSNLEYNLEKGCRGDRYEHIKKQLCSLLNIEDVLIVNNNASAVFLVLNTFAKNKEVILSRGELVEIGGSFRVPDVMRESGCKLREIGTTNKTKLDDYKKAINKKTSILMKIHQSNFTIEGFSQATSYEQILKLAKKKNLLDYYDAGGAYVEDFSLKDNDLDLKKLLKLNPSLVSFSADKLFGSIQAGIIIGKKKYIKKLKKNQLLRMLRVDKITIGILEESIKAYNENNLKFIPTLQLLQRNEKEILKNIEDFTLDLPKEKFEILKTKTYVGGGTFPNKQMQSYGLFIKGNAKENEKFFRQNHVIGRIENDKFLLDFKSLLNKDMQKLKQIVRKFYEL